MPKQRLVGGTAETPKSWRMVLNYVMDQGAASEESYLTLLEQMTEAEVREAMRTVRR